MNALKQPMSALKQPMSALKQPMSALKQPMTLKVEWVTYSKFFEPKCFNITANDIITVKKYLLKSN